MSGFRLQVFPLAAGFLATVAAGLAGFMIFQVGPAFEALTRLPILDFRLAGYEEGDVTRLIAAIANAPEAGTILRAMHLGPDLAFPAAYALLCVMLIARLAPGVTVFHKAMSGWRLAAAIAMPVLYAVADYAENGVSLALFAPAVPSVDTVALLTGWLPLLTRLKAMLFFISLILVLRFVLFRENKATDAEA